MDPQKKQKIIGVWKLTFDRIDRLWKDYVEKTRKAIYKSEFIDMLRLPGIQWIRVEDGSPKDKQEVFLYFGNDRKYVTQGYYSEDAKLFFGESFKGIQPTHWAEINLPEK